MISLSADPVTILPKGGLGSDIYRFLAEWGKILLRIWAVSQMKSTSDIQVAMSFTLCLVELELPVADRD